MQEKDLIEEKELATPPPAIVVTWAADDPDLPTNWSARRKWTTSLCLFNISFLSCINATSPGVMAEFALPWFGITNTQWVLGSFVFLLAVAATPLLLAPASESFGRNAIYQITLALNTVLFLPQILTHSYPALLTSRLIQGMTSSVGNSMVGGSLADMYPSTSRGPMMNALSLFIFAGQSFGGALFGWIGMRAGYQWCYGVQAIAGGVSVIINLCLLRETRADVLLKWKAARLTKSTGIPHLTGDESLPLRDKLKASAIRPLQFLFTEPIVSVICLWIGFAWGCIFLSASSTLLVFGQYGWDAGVTGASEFTVLIGGIIGFLSNYHQEYLYARAARRAKGRAEPEARLYWAATGGFLFPLCLYGYAWTGRSEFHWAIPATFLSLSMAGVYIMYLGVFNYLADAYETYSSSAQAAQSFVRNLFSAVFPLFCRRMYDGLGYPVASTVVAAVATVLGFAPVLIIVYGKRLRARSKVTSAIWAQ